MAGIVVILPIILKRFPLAEFSVLQLFIIIISFEMFLDLGFSSTFARVIAFAVGGATEIKDLRTVSEAPARPGPNWDTLASVICTMRAIYGRLTGAFLVILAVFGTAALLKPISQVSDQGTAWTAWAIVLTSSAFVFWSRQQSSYLLGIGEVALLRRIEAGLGLVTLAACIAVLASGGGLLAFIIARQSCATFGVLWKWRVARNQLGGFFQETPTRGVDRSVFDAIWPSAWRSAVGVAMSAGIVQLSGILHAQVGKVENVASYLLALRLINTLAAFSQAPFYSKLPFLARLRAEGKPAEQLRMARHGMAFSFWSFALGAIGIGLLGDPLLALIHSKVAFVRFELWFLLSLAFFAHRYGAMHIQLYSTTNHIIWHIANGVSGVLMIGLALVFYPMMGVMGFPLAMLIGYLCFYDWYAAMHSYRIIRENFWTYESKTSLVPLLLILVYGALALLVL